MNQSNFTDNFSYLQWVKLQYAVYSIFKIVAIADGKIDQKENQYFSYVFSLAPRLKSRLLAELMESLSEFAQSDSLDDYFDDLKVDFLEIREILENIPEDEAYNFKISLMAIGAYIGIASGKWYDFNKFNDEERNALIDAGIKLNLPRNVLEKIPELKDILKA